MPVVLLLLLPSLLVFFVVVSIVLLPLSVVQRYRLGTARRAGRGWLAAINLASIGLSSGLFVLAAAVTSLWIPNALAYSLAGFAVGAGLGVLGLALTRWEATSGALYYTPNRWLVLGITLVVTARIPTASGAAGRPGVRASTTRRGPQPPGWPGRWQPARPSSVTT